MSDPVIDKGRSRMKVAVVGIGWAGQQHLDAYHHMPGVEIVALAGMEDELREILARRYSIPHTSARWENVLDIEGLDAVSVAVPTYLHAPIAITALNQGIHVLSEKPIARNGDEGQEMVDAARRSGRVLDVTFNHRRRGDIEAVKQLIDRGDLGRPYYAKAAWLRRSGIPRLGSWFTNPEMSGGGALADIGVHVLDYALHLLGEPEALSVSASVYAELGPRGRGGNAQRYSPQETNFDYGVEDFASALIRLAGGVTLHLESGWATYRAAEDLMDLTVFGTEGGAELKALGGARQPVGEVRVFTERGGQNADYSPVVVAGRGHRAVIEEFIEAVRSGPSAWAAYDGSSALKRARIIDACYTSAAQQREVEIVRAELTEAQGAGLERGRA